MQSWHIQLWFSLSYYMSFWFTLYILYHCSKKKIRAIPKRNTWRLSLERDDDKRFEIETYRLVISCIRIWVLCRSLWELKESCISKSWEFTCKKNQQKCLILHFRSIANLQSQGDIPDLIKLLQAQCPSIQRKVPGKVKFILYLLDNPIQAHDRKPASRIKCFLA